ncbi:MAG: hypothetical protein A2747_02920 [Candidatus Yonathbacteria bacterium RIFCSPHIGHO2_01_FULL_44_41]|uniref:Uncharacterized protein n=1 Tax=Candidatus Yonathbacteria bacterium RIFCSPHIGHO2_02_FULL_44_14 TaxID=1802724 RepID=A0A1G2S615_9BACT|nr:MAG: hypothetical protein A2747_02920 [Candidatus Yonathbacteria bacterium RIFCSPHIGHO2_01_FULL_44_41]OHA80540.1 MAG: hypothetical protein A3D51_00470 [Candidatus Yonathbacteria bacterium RIFCSPHIGHO2_02_FULL_44_14]OHA82168.1 MAG: hypothetical protein A3B06_01525 [Candidatus Yonathbacteria bacterium RIFCSPLOWO2_01_FULL_43_20]
MTFPYPDFDHVNLDSQLKKVIDSHGQPLEGLDEEMRDLRTKEGGIMIKPHEIPWMQKMLIFTVGAMDREARDLENSINTYGSGSPINLTNMRARLDEIKQNKKYLKENFAIKFFEDSNNIDKA